MAGHIEVVKLLVERGCVVKHLCHDGLASLHWAVQNRHHELAQWLNKHCFRCKDNDEEANYRITTAPKHPTLTAQRRAVKRGARKQLEEDLKRAEGTYSGYESDPDYEN